MRTDRLEQLEMAVLDYVERYGLTEKARECFSPDMGQEENHARAQPRRSTEPNRPPR